MRAQRTRSHRRRKTTGGLSTRDDGEELEELAVLGVVGGEFAFALDDDDAELEQGQTRAADQVLDGLAVPDFRLDEVSGVRRV